MSEQPVATQVATGTPNIEKAVKQERRGSAEPWYHGSAGGYSGLRRQVLRADGPKQAPPAAGNDIARNTEV